jgi:hypothetical protein
MHNTTPCNIISIPDISIRLVVRSGGGGEERRRHREEMGPPGARRVFRILSIRRSGARPKLRRGRRGHSLRSAQQSPGALHSTTHFLSSALGLRMQNIAHCRAAMGASADDRRYQRYRRDRFRRVRCAFASVDIRRKHLFIWREERCHVVFVPTSPRRHG